MSSPYLPSEELLQLLAALADGELTEEQERRLAELLQADPRARAYYLDYVALLTSLQWEYAAAAVPVEPSGVRPQPERPRRRNRFVLPAAFGLAGLAAGLLLAVLLFRQRTPEPSRDRTEPTDDNVAILLHAPGAAWDETSMPARPSGPLPAGRLLLKSGLAHIQFYSGATVILEGPADFRLISPKEAYCARGKLRAHVPPQAKGFTIGTPKLDLVDVGTEFGLRVDGGDQAEVHVFQGKVELYDPGSNRAAATRKELTTGQGLRLDGPGAGNPITPVSALFQTVRELAARSEAQARRRHRDWLAASEALRQDPRLLVYYDFQTEEPWSRTLEDMARGRQEPRDGAIIGCEWTAGRWPGKQALEFTRPSDRVRIHVPGEYPALTYMAWVRLDSLDHEFTSLLLTDRWSEGSAHWQISKKGELILNVRHWRDNRTHTPPVLGPESAGQWTHLAAVYDQPGMNVTHYLNGRAVSSEEILYPILIKIGSAEIGNWGSPFREHNKVPLRNLNGRVDEFLLFNQALGAREIQDLYEAGKPTP